MELVLRELGRSYGENEEKAVNSEKVSSSC